MKKRRNQIKRCDNKTIAEESRSVTTTDDSADDPQRVLPDEVLLEHILTRLPIKTLKGIPFVSKIWYESIYKNPQFPSLHFQQSKKNPFFIFHLLNSSYDESVLSVKHLIFSIDLDDNKGGHYDYNNVDIRDDDTKDLVFHKKSSFTTLSEIVLVNYCNGFGCYTLSDPTKFNFTIQNPNWRLEILRTTCPKRNHYVKCCYGFGFNALTNEYKVVTLLCNFKHLSNGGELFKAMVYILGTCSWRETDSSPLVAGCAPMKSRMSSSRSAIFVDGFLLWRIFTRRVDNGDQTEMLLVFDLHAENFQLVRIPAECASTSTAERMQVVDHLLVIKGSPCVVVLEKLLLTNGHHANHPPQQRSSPLCCCCCCKIHLYVLKDIIKQAWIKETIDVSTTTFSSLPSSWPSPAKFCCCCSDGTVSPPTRILSFFDRVLLYWFVGSCLWLFDPRKNNLKVVKCSHVDTKFFEHKMKGYHIQKVAGNYADTGNANIYFRDVDVQLITDAENFTSLRAFIPK